MRLLIGCGCGASWRRWTGHQDNAEARSDRCRELLPVGVVCPPIRSRSAPSARLLELDQGRAIGGELARRTDPQRVAADPAGDPVDGRRALADDRPDRVGAQPIGGDPAALADPAPVPRRGDSGPLLFAGRSFIGAFRRSATSHRQSCPVGQSHVLKLLAPWAVADSRATSHARAKNLRVGADCSTISAQTPTRLKRLRAALRNVSQSSPPCAVRCPRSDPRDSAAADGRGAPSVSRLGRGALGPDQSRSTIVMAFQLFIGIRSRFRLES